ncbi:hypothetical protein AHiyo1_33200 [Arthrobacter sp. Hiyo1]|nr:hypothetical protein AHiyo1_33200 [Arthrobacter sp. Hiyo1]
MTHNGKGLLLGFGFTRPGEGTVDVHDVGVRAVADLASALPAHGDHQHVRREGPLGSHDGLGDVQGAQNRSPVGIGQRRAHCVLFQEAGTVRDGDPEDFPAPDEPDKPHRVFRIGVARHLGLDFLPLRLEAQRHEFLVGTKPRNGLRGNLQEIRDEP